MQCCFAVHIYAYRKEVETLIYQRMNLDKNEIQLPIVIVGNGKKENYLNVIHLFKNTIISSNKHNFDSIKSPIDYLAQMKKTLQHSYNMLLSKMQNLKYKQSQIQTQIQIIVDSENQSDATNSLLSDNTMMREVDTKDNSLYDNKQYLPNFLPNHFLTSQQSENNIGHGAAKQDCLMGTRVCQICWCAVMVFVDLLLG